MHPARQLSGLLFDTINPAPVRSVASDEAFEQIRPTLTEREIEVFLLVCDYLEAHPQFSDVTSGELDAWSSQTVLTLRPRCTGLVQKGWLTTHGIRKSRTSWEKRCCPVSPVVPRTAVERARRERTKRR